MFIVIEGSGSGDLKKQEAKGPVTPAATASQMQSPAPAPLLLKPESESDINKERLHMQVCYINFKLIDMANPI